MKVFFLSILLSLSAAGLSAQDNSRPATDAEKAFMQKLGQRMSQILGTAGKTMPGQWLTHFKTDNAAINITQHQGRPHEFRCSFSMEYVASKAESASMQQEMARHNKSMSKADINAGSRLNDPSLKYSIEVSVLINPYQFTPVDVQQLSALGGTAAVPGTVLTLLRTKELGVGAPYYSLYFGDYDLRTKNGKQFLVENFSNSTDCCNARTMLIEVLSNPTVANDYIGNLNLPALTAIIKEL